LSLLREKIFETLTIWASIFTWIWVSIVKVVLMWNQITTDNKQRTEQLLQSCCVLIVFAMATRTCFSSQLRHSNKTVCYYPTSQFTLQIALQKCEILYIGFYTNAYQNVDRKRSNTKSRSSACQIMMVLANDYTDYSDYWYWLRLSGSLPLGGPMLAKLVQIISLKVGDGTCSALSFVT